MQRYTIDEINSMKEKKEKNKKIKRIIIYIIIIPLLLYNAIILFQVFANGSTTPNVFGYKTFVIISGSMEPNLNIGDIAVVKSVDKEELKVEDVISYREGNAIVTHRITEITEDGLYKTKGDANNAEDVSPVKFENIEGKFSFKISKLGYLIIFIQNKIGIIVVAILIYILYISNKRVEEKRFIRKEKRRIFDNTNKQEKR